MANLHDIVYLPILAVRPAEMNALSELPERDKDLLLPAIQLRPWVGAYKFTSTMDKIRDVLGKHRHWIANLDCRYIEPDIKFDTTTGHAIEHREAVNFFKSLCEAQGGFNNWCTFMEQQDNNVIPTVQTNDYADFDLQLTRLARLKRGLAFHFSNQKEVPEDTHLDLIKNIAVDNPVLFIIDFGELLPRQDINLALMEWLNVINKLAETVPKARIAISGTSFPDSFSNGPPKQEIKERQLFNLAIVTGAAKGWNLLYSDRGSARLQAPRGGGGAPYPRIDYPTPKEWHFYRSGKQDGDYAPIAKSLIESDIWDSDLRIWGTQMIEKTAIGDDYAIISPAKATSVRINIHMHRQLFYNEPDSVYDTDDEWVD